MIWAAILAEAGCFGILALGLVVSFRWARFPDLTPDGSFVAGAVLFASLTPFGWVTGVIVAMVGGFLAGAITGCMAMYLRIPPVVSGLITSTGLYSVNWLVLGKPNVFVPAQATILRDARGSLRDVLIGGIALTACLAIVMLAGLVRRSMWGLKLIAVSENRLLERQISVPRRRDTIAAIASSNALVALSGALVAQRGFFADVSMGFGITIAGLTALAFGSLFVSPEETGRRLFMAALLGAIAYKAVLVGALAIGAPPAAFRLVGAAALILVFVLVRARGGDALRGVNWS